jgi:prepilin-type N-terminal cleavage/methylation domain-containing protein
MSMRMRKSRGFTLVELMIVVTLVALTATLTVRAFSKGVRGEKAPAFARALMSQLLEARHQAMTLGRPTRVQLLATVASSSAEMAIETDVYDTNVSPAVWDVLATANVPSQVQLCTPDNKPDVASTTPVCPLPTTASTANILCFSPNGYVNLVTAANGCSTSSSPNAFTGATLYVTDVNNANNGGQSPHLRVIIWGLTGMPKLYETW